MPNGSNQLENSLYELARGVIDPELGSNIVELGMLRSIKVEDSGKVVAEVALTVASCPLRKQIESDLKNRLERHPGVEGVEIRVVSMEAAERAKVMSIARKKAQVERGVLFDASTRILAVASGKGGVGKSSVTAHLALALANLGYRVGLLDADIWGFSIPRIFGLGDERLEATGNSSHFKITPHQVPLEKGELKIVSMGMLGADDDQAIMWRGLMLSRALQHFLEDVDWSGLDYLLIDMPPGTGDVAMALARLAPRTEVIIVTTPALGASKVASRMGDMSNKGNLHVLGVIENMSYFECDHGARYQLFGEGGGDELANRLGVGLLWRIPFLSDSIEYVTHISKGQPLSSAESHFNALASYLSSEVVPIYEMSGCTNRLIKSIEDALSQGAPLAKDSDL